MLDIQDGDVMQRTSSIAGISHNPAGSSRMHVDLVLDVRYLSFDLNGKSNNHSGTSDQIRVTRPLS